MHQRCLRWHWQSVVRGPVLSLDPVLAVLPAASHLGQAASGILSGLVHPTSMGTREWEDSGWPGGWPWLEALTRRRHPLGHPSGREEGKKMLQAPAVPKEGICQLYPLMSSLLSDRQTPTPGGPHSRSKRLWSCHTLKDRTGGTSHRADGKWGSLRQVWWANAHFFFWGQGWPGLRELSASDMWQRTWHQAAPQGRHNNQKQCDYCCWMESDTWRLRRGTRNRSKRDTLFTIIALLFQGDRLMYVIKAQSKCQKCTEEGNRTKETQNSDACKLLIPLRYPC